MGANLPLTLAVQEHDAHRLAVNYSRALREQVSRIDRALMGAGAMPPTHAMLNDAVCLSECLARLALLRSVSQLVEGD